MYNLDNIFAKIIAGSISAEKIYEDEDMIAINDIAPVAPVHILVIPKGTYPDISSFNMHQDETKIAKFFKKVTELANEYAGENYRIITNKGEDAGQTIFHFHMHIIGGKKLENKLV